MPLERSIAEVDLAYAAGIVDGEGSISASVSVHSPLNFRVVIAVSMCDYAVPEFMAHIFGGRVVERKQKTKSGKIVYTWALYCRNAAGALNLMVPYLLIKKARAESAIKLAMMMRPRQIARREKLTFSIEEIRCRHLLADLVTNANFASNGRMTRYAPL